MADHFCRHLLFAGLAAAWLGGNDSAGPTDSTLEPEPSERRVSAPELAVWLEARGRT